MHGNATLLALTVVLRRFALTDLPSPSGLDELSSSEQAANNGRAHARHEQERHQVRVESAGGLAWQWIACGDASAAAFVAIDPGDGAGVDAAADEGLLGDAQWRMRLGGCGSGESRAVVEIVAPAAERSFDSMVTRCVELAPMPDSLRPMVECWLNSSGMGSFVEVSCSVMPMHCAAGGVEVERPRRSSTLPYCPSYCPS